MDDNIRVQRGWIILDATRLDEGGIRRGTGEELRLSPFDALQDRRELEVPAGAILKASVQRLAFWRR